MFNVCTLPQSTFSHLDIMRKCIQVIRFLGWAVHVRSVSTSERTSRFAPKRDKYPKVTVSLRLSAPSPDLIKVFLGFGASAICGDVGGVFP